MMREEIISQAQTLGITEIGFVDPHDLACRKPDSSHAFSNESSSGVFDIMTDAKTIIVFLTGYLPHETPENLSVYAAGKDYHAVCREIAEGIAQPVTQRGFDIKIQVDNGCLNERTAAKLAGLGIIGKNGFLINKKYGSYCFIACIITNCKIEKSKPLAGECLKCGLCESFCPGGALSGASFDESRCASYITQKKGVLTSEEKRILTKSKSAWGCDICQRVCPMNKNAEYTNIHAFSENLVLRLSHEDISGREFRRKYADRAFSWRGKGVIDRNLSILNGKE